MARFALRHWTGILIAVVIAGWALFYLPATPSFAVFEMKRAIDARDGDDAARYVDFESVVRHAGDEMLQKNANDPLSQLLGQGAMEILVKPMAQLARAKAVQDVNDGAREVQMPPAAVAGALILMRRDGDHAFTRFRDNKGREWEIRMARDDRGVWQISEVKDIQQLLEQLQHQQGKQFIQP